MKLLNILINIFVIVGLIFIICYLASCIYKNIKITNKIENPTICIRINDDYYCKVGEKQEKTREIEI